MQIVGLCNSIEVSFVFGGLLVCGGVLLPGKFNTGKLLHFLWSGVFCTYCRNNLYNVFLHQLGLFFGGLWVLDHFSPSSTAPQISRCAVICTEVKNTCGNYPDFLIVLVKCLKNALCKHFPTLCQRLQKERFGLLINEYFSMFLAGLPGVI